MTEPVYELSGDSERYESLRPTDGDHSRFDGFFWNVELAPSWKPPYLEVLPSDDGNFLPESDFPRLWSHVPIISERAHGELFDLLSGTCTFHPLRVRGRSSPYFAMHVTNVLDALDLTRSKVSWMTPDQIMFVDTYVFDDQMIQGQMAFRDRRFLGAVHVAQPVVDRIRQAHLIGARVTRRS